MLAINGGLPLRNSAEHPWPEWPVWGEEEKKALNEVVESKIWSYNGPKETEFLNVWQEFCTVSHALLVSNGTVSLQLALEALDIGYGDEVIVPGVTWQATAGAVVDVNAVPILADVQEDTLCLDPVSAEELITDKTKAIIPVHLYGNMADMDALKELAKKYHLKIIEDAAHKHGGEWKGEKAGTLGNIGSFSLQLSKVLTAGEGGIVTTNDDELWYRLDALRNCGRRPTNEAIDKGSGQYGEEGDLIQSGNYRVTEFQAALLLCQFNRMQTQNQRRETNARHLDSLLSPTPGVSIMKDDPRETRKTYFNYVFRIDEEELGIKVGIFRKALSAELGFEFEACYQPLNDCSLYRPQTKKRYRINEEYWKALDPKRFALPVSQRLFNNETVCMPHRFLMGANEDMEQIATAVKKVIDNKNEISE